MTRRRVTGSACWPTSSRTSSSRAARCAKRFPLYCRPVGASANLSLAERHKPNGSLEKFCNEKIFPDDVAALISKSTVAAKDALTGKVSKDATVEIHSGEAFSSYLAVRFGERRLIGGATQRVVAPQPVEGVGAPANNTGSSHPRSPASRVRGRCLHGFVAGPS